MPQPPSPEAVFARLARARHAAFLDSAAGGGWSILAAEPRSVIRHPDPARPGEPLAAVRRGLELLRPEAGGPELPFRAGAIGYLGYGLRHAIERLPSAARPDPLPDLWFGIYERALLYEHGRGTWHATGPWRPGEAEALLESAREPAPPADPPPVALERDFERAAYEAAVRRVKEHLAAGDAYQVNLSQRFCAPLQEPPAELYRRLRAANPAPFGAYLDLGGGRAVLSSSPERFLKLVGRRAVTRPIKGTRPRGASPAEDARLAAELLASPKDAAELAMIVDLLRNDLGRVAAWGSVRVAEPVRLESYAGVHHLVATIEAELADGRDWADLVRATFPCGSVTGAPKIRAMEIIAGLEPVERGVYTGAIGYVDASGDMDLAVAIRTVVTAGGRAWFHAGGGIVADSDPAAEYEETLVKARRLALAVGAEL